MSYISNGNGPALVASAVVPLVLTWGFSSVRIYICFTILASSALMAAIHGNGQKLASISLTDLPIAMQYWFSAEIFYTLTTIFIRLSIGFFLLRICTSRKHIWIIQIAMVVMSILTITYLILVVVQCHPINYFWLRFSGGEGSCFSGRTVEDVTIVFSVFAALTDLIFGILPIFVIWNLQMNPRAKAIVGGLLTLGVLAGLTVIIRMYYVHKVDPALDFLYATSKVSIWSMIEPAIGICCMAASTYRPLFKSLLEKASGTTQIQPNRSLHRKKNSVPSRTGSALFSRSKIGSMKSNHTKNSDSFDFEMKMDTYETTAEGPGKKKGRKEENWDMKNGIMQSTTVEIRRMTRSDDMV